MRCGRGSDRGRGAVLMAGVPVAGKFWCGPACPSSGCRRGPSSDHKPNTACGRSSDPTLARRRQVLVHTPPRIRA